jgi:drug/metabolite transporter (DMT)-like permease
MKIDLSLQRYALLALLAAALFGASTPIAKRLLVDTSPQILAGLLYLGSGLGLSILFVLRRLLQGRTSESTHSGLHGKDWGWLGGAILSGGVLGPLLLMWGLQTTLAGSAALLLNVEGVLTTLVAGVLFREAVGRRIWLAALVMLLGGLLLSYDPQARFSLSLGSLAIVGACLMWAFDNNLTRNISAGDPGFIAMSKVFAAGGINLALGLMQGGHLPASLPLAGSMLLGFLSYGISLVLFILALRHLGSARTGAHFSTAPLFGAALAVFWLGEPASPLFMLAIGLMVLATWLVLSEQHEHEHSHEHQPLIHTHKHLPDIHHRHGHEYS